MTKQDKNDSGKTKSKTSQFLKGPLLSVCFLPSPTVSSQKHTHTHTHIAVQYKKGKTRIQTYMKLVSTGKSSTRRDRGTATRRDGGTATRRDGAGTAIRRDGGTATSSPSSSTELPAKTIAQLYSRNMGKNSAAVLLNIYCTIQQLTCACP